MLSISCVSNQTVRQASDWIPNLLRVDTVHPARSARTIHIGRVESAILP
jgi:hypothetical protein